MQKENPEGRIDIDKLSEYFNNFWIDTYPKYSFEERLQYWSGDLYSTLRDSGGRGRDEFENFTPEWYQEIKLHEPLFDEMVKIIFRKKWAGLTWSEREFYKRVGKTDTEIEELLKVETKKSLVQKIFGNIFK